MSEWTKQIPRERGWYWWKPQRKSDPRPVHVNGRTMHAIYSNPQVIRLRDPRTVMRGTFWPIPIQPPQEPRHAD